MIDRWAKDKKRKSCVATDIRTMLGAGITITPIVPIVPEITLGILSKVAYFRTLLLPIILLSVFSLSGCSNYGSSFTCRDASGLDCMTLSVVDQKINSGEIAEVELKAIAKCKGRNCYATSITEKPEIKSSKTHRIKLQDEIDQNECEVKGGDVLYIQ